MIAKARPPYPLCFLALSVTKLALAVTGMRRIVRSIDALWSSGAAQAAPSRLELEDIARRVTIAAAFFPGRARCLEQSIVLYALLRRAGVPARIRLGVRPHPFEAHAWVEYGGDPILEDPEKVARFIPLPESAA